MLPKVGAALSLSAAAGLVAFVAPAMADVGPPPVAVQESPTLAVTSPSDQPTVTETTSPTPTDQPTATPTETATATPTEEPTQTPTATATATESAPAATESESSPSPSLTATRTARPGTTPAVQDSSIGAWSIVVAAVVLALAGLLLWWVYRRHRDEGTQPAEALPSLVEDTVELAPVVVTEEPTAPSAGAPARGAGTENVRFLVDLGGAMIDSGAPVTHVQVVLHQVAARLGLEAAEVVVLPTLLMVSLPGEATVDTAVAAAGTARFRLDQIDSVYQVVDEGIAGDLDAERGRERLRRIRSLPPPRGPVARTVGYVVLTLGLALVLGGSPADLLVAAVLGLGVGGVQLLASRLPLTYTVFAPVACSFGVALAVFLLARSDTDVGVFAPVVAPIVTFLPGALLTTSAIELATGQMISGAGRLAAGAMQLVLLAIGIVAAAQLVGVPATSIEESAAHELGSWAPWVGVAVFGFGMVVHQCARPASFGWILVVLYVAYAGQVIGGLFFGGVLSAFFGAVAMTPVAMFAATQRNGPPALVSFLPAFWLLVPGALGLLGVTAFIGDDRLEGVTTLVTTASTMIAIALGVLVGLAAGGVLGQLARRAGALPPS